MRSHTDFGYVTRYLMLFSRSQPWTSRNLTVNWLLFFVDVAWSALSF